MAPSFSSQGTVCIWRGQPDLLLVTHDSPGLPGGGPPAVLGIRDSVRTKLLCWTRTSLPWAWMEGRMEVRMEGRCRGKWRGDGVAVLGEYAG